MLLLRKETLESSLTPHSPSLPIFSAFSMACKIGLLSDYLGPNPVELVLAQVISLSKSEKASFF